MVDPADFATRCSSGAPSWLCVNLARTAPPLLIVDDLQWADGSSLAWLGYFSRRVSELPALLAVSVREGEPGTRPAPAPPRPRHLHPVDG
jgi:hypothetical protein